MATAAETQAKQRTALPIAGEDPRLEADAAAVHHALNELVRVYQFRDRDRICCYDVSVTQCYALEAVVQGEPLTLNELAAKLYLDKSTASRVVDGLEKKGLVERRQNPDDRRALHLAATRRGAPAAREDRGGRPGAGAGAPRPLPPRGAAVHGRADGPARARRGDADRHRRRELLHHRLSGRGPPARGPVFSEV
jgi:DNA-binding MarR family transcriptional regulator